MRMVSYPVIFTREDNVIYVGVPDLLLDCYTTYADDNNIETAKRYAEEIISLHLVDEKELPKQTDFKILECTLSENQEIYNIEFDLDEAAKEIVRTE